MIFIWTNAGQPARSGQLAGDRKSLTLLPELLFRSFLIALLAFMLSACAIRPFHGAGLDNASFLERTLVERQGNLVISTAVPDARETRQLTGLDLYDQGIQPVWIKIENQSAAAARVAIWSIDRHYFSPIEVAYMNRKRFSAAGYRDMERWFHQNSLPRIIPPGETRSGLVYTNLMPGTKGFNLNIFNEGQMVNVTFFVPLPGFVADFMEVDFGSLYNEEQIRDLSQEELRLALEEDLPCCATGPEGNEAGAPFNAVLVGTGTAVRRSLLRGAWVETAAGPGVADRARQQRYRGRAPDAIFTRWREDGTERTLLHLWVAPWRVDGEPVWLGQVYYWTDRDRIIDRLWSQQVDTDLNFLSIFARESVTADLDSAQRFLLQNLWYNGSLLKAGYTGGVGAASVDDPRQIFTGVSYFTRGDRIVLFLSETGVALDDTRTVYERQVVKPPENNLLFRGKQIPPPNDRLYRQEESALTVATAVPSAEETRSIFNIDLYARNIQPVWVRVENRSDRTLFLTPMGLDPAYFTARETASRSRGSGELLFAPKIEKHSMEQLAVPPDSIQSGYIFTRVDEGTKSFNVDVVGDGKPRMMTFFVPVPGLKLDHYEVDIQGMYPASELKHVGLEELVAEIEALPCCVRDAKGKDKGDPLNLVFVADIKDLYYAFMRSGWDETETIYGSSLLKTMSSALTGGRYRYSPVSALYVFGRPQDAAMQRARESIHERNHLRIWLTPLRHEGKPVWIGQISRDIGVRLTWRTITTHKIDPDVDETRDFLLEDLAYAQSIGRFGYVGGVGAARYEQPRANLTGDPYFTDGKRLVMWIADEPTALGEIEVLDLSR